MGWGGGTKKGHQVACKFFGRKLGRKGMIAGYAPSGSVKKSLQKYAVFNSHN